MNWLLAIIAVELAVIIGYLREQSPSQQLKRELAVLSQKSDTLKQAVKDNQ